jgi:hypothetical protein
MNKVKSSRKSKKEISNMPFMNQIALTEIDINNFKKKDKPKVMEFLRQDGSLYCRIQFPSKEPEPAKVFDDFTDDDIAWYYPRLHAKLGYLDWKRTYLIFQEFGKEKIKRYYNNYDKLDNKGWFNRDCMLASFRMAMKNNRLEKMEMEKDENE